MAKGDAFMVRTPTDLFSKHLITARLSAPFWFLIRPQLLTRV
jgi:hypothetical protein